MTEKLNRREFLTVNWESTIGFIGNFIAPQIEMDRSFIRPPGACDELEFLTSCTRCGKCKEICPEGSIRLFSFSSGAKLVNTPYLDPNETPCSFCEKCIDVCPTEALNLLELKDRPFIGVAKILPERCLAFQSVMCDYCVRSCSESGALELRDGKPTVSPQNCTGCGKCVTTCMAEGKAIKVVVKEG